MVYIFGLAIVFIFVVAFWCIRAIIIAVQNYLARRRDPTLPMPVSTQPSLSDTAESVFGRFIASTMAGVGESPLSPPPAADRRRSSVYSGVVRAHPDCGSDPDLPKYSQSPTASRPELLIIEDDNLPPPLTPRSGSPTPSERSSAILTPVEEAPGYTTRPGTPTLSLVTSNTSPPASPVHVTFVDSQSPALPTPPPQARRKHNQRRGSGHISGFAYISPI